VSEKLGWMTWDQVREMRDQGFQIGAHTASHADLGVAPIEEARVELTESRQRLEMELGQIVDLFAYPYGGVENINADSRELVRKAGYRCCLSSHGGLTNDGTDPFHLQRIPISPWYENTGQLALALGLRRA
jgi:peptidoglycan/xylan/chitin deacetylase (PgdA/CDA1 family)